MTCDEHVSHWAGHVNFGLSFHVLSISEVALDSFAVEFWGWVVLYSIVLSSMMLFKRSFGLTRSLFILYVHEHDHRGLGMLSVETAVFDCICWFSSSRDRKGQSYLVEYCLEVVEEYTEGKIHKSEPEPGWIFSTKFKDCCKCFSSIKLNWRRHAT